MSTLTSKDLAKEFPSSPYDELGGIPWLPRLIDKARAYYTGKMGEYLPYPCGGDQRFLAAIGVDAEPLGQYIKGGASDEEILVWVKARLGSAAEEGLKGFRAYAENSVPTELAAYFEDAKSEYAKAHPGVDLSRVINFPHLMCQEEGHPLPQVPHRA